MTATLLERKISFLNCLFVLSAFLVFFLLTTFLLSAFFFCIRIFVSAFSHPHLPSAGIRSSFYRHPEAYCSITVDGQSDLTILLRL